jgi:hypothetical protein
MDSESGTMLMSGFIGYDKDEFENTTAIIFSADSSVFVELKRGNWQIWDAKKPTCC